MKNYKKYFKKAIQNNFPNNSEHLLSEIERDFQILSEGIKFSFNSKNPMDKRLDFSAYFLALIKVLDKAGVNFARIREISLEIVTEYVRPKNKIQELLKRLPVKLVNTNLANMLLSILDKKLNKKAHPAGFVAKIITFINFVYHSKK